MSSSAHSALASLMGNYTDSEPEEDDVEKSEDVVEKEESDSSKLKSNAIFNLVKHN